MTSGAPEIVAALFMALLNSFWQGVAAATLYAVLYPLFKHPQAKYLLAMTAFAAMPVAFLTTFGIALSQMAGGAQSNSGLQFANAQFEWYFVVCWSIGVCLFGLRLLGGWCWLRMTIVRHAQEAPPELQRVFVALRRRLGVSSRVRLRISDSINNAVALGVVQPLVLLPLSMLSGASPDVVRAALVHELSHLRRFDHIAVVFQAIGESLLFFHPAIWWLSKETRRLREYRCDDDSIEVFGDKHAYARVLVALEEQRSTYYRPKLAMNGGNLMDRIEKIFSPQGRAGSAPLGFPALMLTLLLGVTLVSLSHSEEQRSEKPMLDHQRVSIRWLPDSVSRWRDQIEIAARRHQVPADFLALVLLVESNGNEKAVSSNGAQGLMQVMPATAQLIASRRGMEDFGPEQLLEPETNIDFGAWYLAEQMSLFSSHGDDVLPLAIAAYNAGPKAVQASLAGDGDLAEETRHYRDRVMRMWSERHQPRSSVLPKDTQSTTQPKTSVVPVIGYVSSRFGAVGKNQIIHTGTDIVAPAGTPVQSALAGTVRAVGEDDKRGKFVIVEHPKGVETRYYHMNKIVAQEAARVRVGDVIGEVGSTGQSTGPHLHFEIRQDGTPVSPGPYGFEFGSK